MKHLARHAGRSALALLITGTLLFGGVTIHTERRLARHYEVAPAKLALPSSEANDAVIAHGRDLAKSAGCTNCHADDLGGKIQLDGSLSGTIAAPNLTGGRKGAPLTDEDFVRATRYAVKSDGRPLVGMPALDAADADLSALLLYLRSLPAIDREVPATRLGPLGRVAMTMSTAGTRFTLYAETLPASPATPTPAPVVR